MKSYCLVFLLLVGMSLISACQESGDDIAVHEQTVLLASASPQVDEFAVFLNEFSTSNLETYIHPDLGFYILHKPSAVAVVEHFSNFEDVSVQLPHLETQFKNIRIQSPLAQNFPKYDCENFSKTGIFYQKAENFKEISSHLTAMSQALEKDVPSEEQQFAKDVDKKITRLVVSTTDFLEMGFVKENGKWYLTWINLAKYDCSA